MSHHRFHSSAPFGVKALAVMTAVDGAVGLVDALGTGPPLLAAGLAAVAVANLALAYGLWQLEPYAYPLGMAIFGAGIALDLFAGNVLGAVLSTGTISMLYHYRGLYWD